MKSSRALIILAVFIVIGFVVGKILIKKRRAELLSYRPPRVYPLPVEYATVREGKLREKFNYVGEVLPYTYADISTKVSGTLLKIYKREGDHFKKGELLAKIDDSQIRNSILALENEEKAKASLISGLESQLKAAQVAEKNAKKEYERELFLYRRGAVPEEAVEKYQTNYESAAARVKTLKSQIEELKLAVKSIEKNRKALASQLKYTEIRAVKNGTVANVLMYPGAVALPGKPIMRVFYDSDGFRVLVNVPPQEAKEIETGSVALVEGEPIGEVSKVYPAANRENSLYTVEVKLKNSSGIKPGQLVKVTLVGKAVKGLVLPYTAILHTKNGTVVVVLEGRKVKPVPVKVKKQVNNRVVVVGNLKPGQKVAVGRESKLLEILRVRNVVPAEAFNG